MRTTRLFALGLSLAVLAGGSVAKASLQALGDEHVYRVEEVRAEWTVPRPDNGKPRLYVVAGARYEDLQSHEVFSFARAEWMNCTAHGDGLSCGGGPKQFRILSGKPSEFEFADDLSRARLTLVSKGETESAEWTAKDALTEPFDFAPGYTERTEYCNGDEGNGRGLYRRMRAEGVTFNRTFSKEKSRGFTSIERYVLKTECAPSDWWGGVDLAGVLNRRR